MNSNRFLETIPEERKVRIRYEDLVTEPERIMQDMCHNFGLEFHPDLANPYKDIETKNGRRHPRRIGTHG